MITYRKNNPKFDGYNYDSLKNKMRTHLICLGIDYWMITKNQVNIKIENELSSCTDEDRRVFT